MLRNYLKVGNGSDLGDGSDLRDAGYTKKFYVQNPNVILN